MKKNTTKRALIMSMISLLVCVSMLIGTTYAWFTDSVTSGGNIIKSGTLDVEMQWAEGTLDPAAAATTWNDASQGAIFNYDLWEPGFTQVRHLRIANVGTLALKYQVSIKYNGVLEETSDGLTLADAIDVYVADPATQADARSTLTGYELKGSLKNYIAGMSTAAHGTLLAGEANSTNTISIALKMRETAGNEYQNMSLGGSFSVQLLATQLTSEADSFDNQYDAQAEYGEAVMQAESSAPVTYDQTVSTPTVLTTNGGTAQVEIPAGVEDLDEKQVALYVEPDEDDPDVTVDTGNSLTTYDVSLKDVATQTPVTAENVVYTVKLVIGVVDLQKFYHHNTELTAVTNLADLALNKYYYDQATGTITFMTDSFSPFSSEYLFAGGIGTEAYPYLIEDNEQLQSISKLSNNYYDAYNLDVPEDVETKSAYYKMANANAEIDMSAMQFIWLDGCFDGNGVTFNNVGRCVFYETSNYDNSGYKTSIFKNFTVNANIARNSYFESAVVLYPDNDITFENVNVHGYIEGTAAAPYVALGPGPNTVINYTFKNCNSDATVVATGESASGFIVHPYCKGGSTMTLEGSRYTGAMVAKGTTYYFRVNASGTPFTITTDETDGAALYTNPADSYTGNADLYSSPAKYIKNSSKLTISAIAAPEGKDYLEVPKAEGASYAVATLNIGPNDQNDKGNYMGVYINENCIDNGDAFVTQTIKNFDVTINGDKTASTGISADGTTFNIVNSWYGTTYGSAFVRIIQYTANGEIVKISTLAL